MFNPFTNSDGSLKINNLNYGQLLKNSSVSDKAKTFIESATGLSRPNTEQSSAQTAGTSLSSVDPESLVKLDVSSELPKLSVDQISTIISTHFNKSPVISPSDAEGIYNAQNSTGMSALAILSIGALESGYGTSSIAKKKNNLWGWGAVNSNPSGAAKSFAPVSEGATTFAEKYMSTYYNKYGAKSIYDAGTGNNPSGMGYAYTDGGAIDSSWATKVGSIMKNFYSTAGGSLSDLTQGQQTVSTGNQNSNSPSNSKIVKMYAFEHSGNPFVDNEGNLLNPNINYQAVLNNPNVSAKVKAYIQQATGLSPTVPTNSISSQFSANSIQSDSSIVSAAKSYIGTPYVWGGESMSEGGMDCSGFVYNALKDAGYKVGRESAQGYRSYGTKVSKSDMQPGDLVFYGKNGKATHIGIYAGNGQIIHSAGGSKNTKSNPGKGVSVTSVDHRQDFMEARRY